VRRKAADVTRRHADRAQRADHDVREILTNAAALIESFGDRRVDGGGALSNRIVSFNALPIDRTTARAVSPRAL